MSFKILSFCGGGIRGYMSSLLLQKLESHIQENYNRSILKSVDMIAGTSTGAVIGGLLAAKKDEAIKLLPQFYKGFMAATFKQGNHSNPLRPETNLNSQIAEYIEATLLKGLSLKDVTAFKLLTTAFYIDSVQSRVPGTSGDKTQSWGMMLFNNFDGSPTRDTSLIDAMLASGAMPGMTGSVEVDVNTEYDGKRKLHFVDGAFVNHDPTLAAIAHAVKAGHKLEDISVITIGTGFMQNYISNPESTMDWGTEQWMSLPGGNSSLVPPLLVNTDKKTPILNLCLNGTSTNEIPSLSELMLQERYAYLNPDMGTDYIAEDAFDDKAFNTMELAVENTGMQKAYEVLNSWVKSE